jgi:copper chaperone CopZ
MIRRLLLALVFSAGAASAQATTIEMKVFGMVCGFCAQGIEANLRKNPAIVDVKVSLETKLVRVETRGTEDVPDADLRKAIADAGYDVKSITRSPGTLAEK